MVRSGLHGENRELAHIPGTDGWPLLGNTAKFYRDGYGYGAALFERYGEVYRNHAFMLRFVTFASPDGADFVLRDADKNFSARQGWMPIMGAIYPGTLQLMDGDVHRSQRQAINSVFQTSAMRGYCELISQTVWTHVSSWPTERTLQMYGKLKELVFAMSARAFLGLPLERDVAFVMRQLALLDGGLTALIPHPVPGSTLWKALRARGRLLAYFKPLIAARRGSDGKDLFTRLCSATDDSGMPLSDDAIIDQLLGVLQASLETTTGGLATALYHLAREREWQARLRANAEALGAGPLHHPNVAAHLDEHELVFFEALRIIPVAPLLFRRSVRDCEFKGFQISACTQVAVDVGHILRSPLYWTDPLRFDPLRFAEPRCEHKRQRSQWLPFGAGAHYCIGYQYAVVAAKIILHHVLARYELERVGGPLEVYTLPATVPKDGLRMRLRAR